MDKKPEPTTTTSLTDLKGTQEASEFLETRYRNSPIARTIMQFVPAVGSAFDTYLTTTLDNLQKERLTIFLKRLERNEIMLTEETAKSHDVVHCILITLKAVSATHRKRKIEMFADLFSSYISKEVGLVIDDFEDYLKILDSLALREMMILLCIARYEEEVEFSKASGDARILNEYWPKCMEEIEKTLHLQQDEIKALICRLTASGCFESYVGVYDVAPPMGRLTPVFYQIKKYSLDAWQKKE